MKALPTSPSLSTIALERNGDFRGFNLTTHELGFFSSKKLLNVGFFICLKHKPLQLVSASTPSSSSSLSKTTGFEDAVSKTQEKYQLKTVRVKFQLKKECSFGEQFALVGDDPMLGMWDPANAIPLNWSDGHVWTLELDIPIGKSIQFKFILKEITGKILWQPGPDRIFETWDTQNTIVVSEAWEDATFQILLEEETIYNKEVEPTVNSEMLIAADNLTINSEMLAFAEDLTHQNEELASDVNSYPTKEPLPPTPEKPITADSIPPPEEERMFIVADNNSYIKEDPVVRASHQVVCDFGSNHEKDGNEAITNKEAMIAEEIDRENGGVPKEMNSANMNKKGNLVVHEGNPVLVPGLPPFSVFSSESVIQDEGETSNVFDASVGVHEGVTNSGFDTLIGVKDEVKNHNLPETANNIQLEKEPESDDDPHKAEKVEMLSDQEQLHYEVEQNSPGEPSKNGVFQNDIQWGRNTIQKLLINLGFLWSIKRY